MSNDSVSVVTTDEGNSAAGAGEAKHWCCTVWRTLLEQKVLICVSCQKLFKNGVYTIQKVGNVCKDCLLENGWTGERQQIYDVILENVPVVSCSNASKGCQELFLPEDLELFLPEDLDNHLKYCRLREVQCVSQGCSWKGNQAKIADHFQNQHKDDVIQGVSFSFNLEVVKDSFVISKLLIKSNLKYLLVIERKQGTDKICYRLYAVDEVEPRHVTIGHVSNNKHFNLDINTKPLNMIDKKCTPTKVDLKALKTTLQENSSYLIIVQVPMNKADQVLQILECPSCFETMKPPIYLCTRGHSVCSACFPKSSLCLKCSGNVNKQSRANSLEALTADIIYPCVNKIAGCKELLLGCEMEKHESKCFYTKYACPMEGCLSKSIFDDFKWHIKVKHGNVSQVNELSYPFKFATIFDKTVLMFVNGYFFSVSYQMKSENRYNMYMGNRQYSTPENVMTCTVSPLTSSVPPVGNYYCNIAIRNSEDEREIHFIDSFTENRRSITFALYKSDSDRHFKGLTDLILCVKVCKSLM